MKWDGSTWDAPGNYNGVVEQIAVTDKGVVCVGYVETNSHAGIHVEGDGVNCFGPDAPPKAPGLKGIISLAAGRGDTLYAVGIGEGSFTPFMSVWDGRVWSIEELVEAPRPLEYADGKLYAVIDKSIQVMDSEGWTRITDLPEIYPQAFAGSLSGQPLFVLGQMNRESVILKLEDDEWSTISDSLTGWIKSISLDAAGRLYAVGNIRHRSRSHISGFAWWDGQEWSGFDTGGKGMSSGVDALQAMPDGCVYAGGDFTLAGSKSVRGFACWDGEDWSDPRNDGEINPEFVSSIVRGPDGTMYVIGRSNQEEHGDRSLIFKRQDTDWSIIPSPAGGAISQVDLRMDALLSRRLMIQREP